MSTQANDTVTDTPPAATTEMNGSQDTTATAGDSCDEMPKLIELKSLTMGVYDGIVLPQGEDPVDVHVHKVKTMQIRDSDVLLCTYPKCGTHWVWRILDMLVSKSAEYSPRFVDLTMLDMQKIDKVKNVESPRVLVSHYPFNLLPEQALTSPAKLIHVYRHPKAVMVSLFFQLRGTLLPNITLSELEQQMAAGKAPYGNQFQYLDSVIEYEKQHPDKKVFHIAYEDIKKDTAGSIKKMAEHLEIDVTDELCSQIAQAVSFKNQKSQEEKATGDTQAKFYRKGESGDWKNHLTVAQSERLDACISDRVDSCTFCDHFKRMESF